MDSIKFLLYFLLADFILALLAIAPSMAVTPPSDLSVAEIDGHELFQTSRVETLKLKQNSPPPPRKNPGSSAAGGRRDSTVCPQDADTATPYPGLTALSPTTKPGITLLERPTFFVFVPKTSAKTAEFSLRESNGSGVYRTTIALTHTSGVVSLSLPAQAPPLTVGKQYTWSFAIVCDPSDRLDDRFVTSTVQRIELDPTHLRQIQQTPPKERVSLYQQANVWYDGVAVLFELHRTQPHDPSVNTIRREFLQAGGVDDVLEIQLSQKNSR